MRAPTSGRESAKCSASLLMLTPLLSQYSAASLHTRLRPSGAGCHVGGPARESNPIETGAALIMPTKLLMKRQIHEVRKGAPNSQSTDSVLGEEGDMVKECLVVESAARVGKHSVYLNVWVG